MALGVYPSHALIRRELLTLLRRPRAFVMLLLLCIVAMLALTVAWPSQREAFHQAPQAARNMLCAVTASLMAIALLILPGVAGGAFISERERDTYDLLHLSLIRPSSMLFGKMASTIGLFLLLAIGILPIVGVIFFLVGLDAQEVLAQFGLLAVTILTCTSIGLFSSLAFRRSMVAMAMSYGLSIVALGGGIVLLVFCGEIFHGNLLSSPANWLFDVGLFQATPWRGQYSSAIAVEAFVSAFCPFFALVSDANTGPVYAVRVGVQLLWSALFLSGALFFLRRPPRFIQIAHTKIIDDNAVLEARRKTFPFYLMDPLRRKKQIEDHRNPVFVKEVRWGMLGRAAVLLRVFYGALLLNLIVIPSLAVMMIWDGEGEAWSMTLSSALSASLTLVMAPVLLANALTKESEQGNMDMLRMTLQAPHQIIAGKMKAGLLNILPLAVPTVAVLFFLGVIAAVSWQEWHILWVASETATVFIVCIAVVFAVSMCASLHAASTQVAVTASYGLSLLLLVGPFFITLFGVQLMDKLGQGYGHWERRHFFSTTPVSALLYNYSNRDPAPWGDEIALLLGNLLAYALLALVLLAYVLWRFEKKQMRG
jgi:ABC-2 type transport system permease protein